MATLHSCWKHGTALTVESPENLLRTGYYDWGAGVHIKPGKSSWFHVPLSSPKLPDGDTLRLLRTYLFFNTFHCTIRNIHIYDGLVKVEEFNNLLLKDEHRFKKDPANTFNLSRGHVVQTRIKISFFCVASHPSDAEMSTPQLIISTARADYLTGYDHVKELPAHKLVIGALGY